MDTHDFELAGSHYVVTVDGGQFIATKDSEPFITTFVGTFPPVPEPPIIESELDETTVGPFPPTPDEMAQ